MVFKPRPADSKPKKAQKTSQFVQMLLMESAPVHARMDRLRTAWEVVQPSVLEWLVAHEDDDRCTAMRRHTERLQACLNEGDDPDLATVTFLLVKNSVRLGVCRGAWGVVVRASVHAWGWVGFG